MLPLVSIIAPCYNAASFISQAIESVLAQLFGNWEMLIVDDCSSDDSLVIIQKYAEQDSRIRYLKTDEPSGSPTLPRNKGIKEAKGRYIAFLDSDDMWLPNKLSDQLKVFEKSEVAIVFSNYHSVSSNKLKAMRWQWNILRNEMDLPVYKAVYYFIHYAIRAFAKAMR